MQNNVIVDDDGAIEVFNRINTFRTNAALARVSVHVLKLKLPYSPNDEC